MRKRQIGTCAACGQVADGAKPYTYRVELGRRGEGTLVRRAYHAACVELMSTQERHDRDNGGRTCSDYCKRTHALHLVAAREEAAL